MFEKGSDRDRFAVGMKKGEQIVGHVPRELSRIGLTFPEAQTAVTGEVFHA